MIKLHRWMPPLSNSQLTMVAKVSTCRSSDFVSFAFGSLYTGSLHGDQDFKTYLLVQCPTWTIGADKTSKTEKAWNLKLIWHISSLWIHLHSLKSCQHAWPVGKGVPFLLHTLQYYLLWKPAVESELRKSRLVAASWREQKEISYP